MIANSAPVATLDLKRKHRMQEVSLHAVNRIPAISCLNQTQCRQSRLIDGRRDRKAMIALEICDCRTRHRSKRSIDRATIIALLLERDLHIYNNLPRLQIAVTVNRPGVWIGIKSQIVTPGRIPVTRVPIIISTIHQHDGVIARPPPVAIVRYAMIIAKCRIVLPPKARACPRVGDRHTSACRGHPRRSGRRPAIGVSRCGPRVSRCLKLWRLFPADPGS
jgi:hypothetical protein